MANEVPYYTDEVCGQTLGEGVPATSIETKETSGTDHGSFFVLISYF